MNHSISELLMRARRLSQSGHFVESAQHYQQILDLQPDNPSVHFELGVIEFGQGLHKSAITRLRKAIELDSDQATFHNGLGIILSDSGDLPAGARCFEQALKLDFNNPAAHNNLGSNCRQQGRLTDAIDCYRRAISVNPQYTKATINLGEALCLLGQLPAATDVYRQALVITPEYPDLKFNLAVTLHYMEQYEEAASLFKALISDHPQYPGAQNNLGLTLVKLGRFTEAIAIYRAVIDSDPTAAAPHNNLGNALRDQNKLKEAIASYRHALILRPNHAQAHSNILLALNYLPKISQSEQFEAAVQFETQQVSNLSTSQPHFRNIQDEYKRLKIGYVSPDFRAHSVAHFTRKLIGAHDRDRVEVFCYANVMKPDRVTSEFRAQADHWRSIVGMDDQAVTELIRDDRIDILIDLAGHTANNRLLVFALRPAPIQVNWLGYPNTTGLAGMNYRFTDAIADPPDTSDRWHTEQLIRLPHGFLCYQPDHTNPVVAGCPSLTQEHITFGSFNSLPKVTADVARVWSRILQATPDAHLVLKSSAFAHETTRTRTQQEFHAHGIAAERIELLGLIPGRDQHLAAYSRVDIGLDPFPYNGTTTTCEALWMGVPVISLRGDRHSGRVGASILHHAGLPELLAEDEDEYVAKACLLAADEQRRISLRNSLREKMRESALINITQFTRSLETAYRDMWKAWCRQN